MLRVSIEVGGKPDAWSMIPAFDEDGNLYYSGAYEFAHDLEWYRKCIRAAERFYQSEDPDRFLEHDGYEDK